MTTYLERPKSAELNGDDEKNWTAKMVRGRGKMMIEEKRERREIFYA